jgi:hypothetical protein
MVKPVAKLKKPMAALFFFSALFPLAAQVELDPH